MDFLVLRPTGLTWFVAAADRCPSDIPRIPWAKPYHEPQEQFKNMGGHVAVYDSMPWPCLTCWYRSSLLWQKKSYFSGLASIAWEHVVLIRNAVARKAVPRVSFTVLKMDRRHTSSTCPN